LPNIVTNETRKVKENLESKLVDKIKKDIKLFYAYIKSKSIVLYSHGDSGKSTAGGAG